MLCLGLVLSGCASVNPSLPGNAGTAIEIEHRAESTATPIEDLLGYVNQAQQLGAEERKEMIRYQKERLRGEDTQWQRLKLAILLAAPNGSVDELHIARNIFVEYLNEPPSSTPDHAVQTFVALQLSQLNALARKTEKCEALRIDNVELHSKLKKIKMIEAQINNRRIDEIQLEK